MVDFLHIEKEDKDKIATSIIYPTFIIGKSSDLMIRGRDFYAVWNEDKGLWETDESMVIKMIDKELDRWVKEHHDILNRNVIVKYMWNASTDSIDAWHHYVQKQMRDNFVQLDSKLIFKNTKTTKLDYASRKLKYDIGPGDTDNYDEFMTTIFDPPEREKLEWALGAIISGDSKEIQKFIVLYGAPGTGKSTFIDYIVKPLFHGYYTTFEAKSLAGRNNQFSLESFKSNPLVAIQADGDLSMIVDNTKLNSIVSHDEMVVNEKFKSQYSMKFQSFLFMGTNEPVAITGSKSGLNRRLIDVRPSGRKFSPKDYRRVTKGIGAEIGAIADKCLKIYLDMGKDFYNGYVPRDMQEETDTFFNFISDYYYEEIKDKDGIQLSKAWTDYKLYCEDKLIKYPYPYPKFRSELKEYFMDYDDRKTLDNGERVRKWYSGFKREKIIGDFVGSREKVKKYTIIFEDAKPHENVFDRECGDCLAQLATAYEKPGSAWDDVKTILKDIDTSVLHYVRLPVNHIVIDFDLKNEKGDKDYALNLKEASKWPQTYAELSKSGAGIHLHYIYEGDPTLLLRQYAEDIEIKVFTGKSSLRRRLSKCNDLPIATLNEGMLPMKGGKNVLNRTSASNENHLRAKVYKALKKEVWPNTKPSMDYIYMVMEEAYKSGIPYDLTNLKQQVYLFAMASSHQSDYCIELWNKIHWRSEEDIPPDKEEGERPIVFFDVEVFPNLFILCWKYRGLDKSVTALINPTAEEVTEWIKMDTNKIGFNNRKYDNHIVYARSMGYTNKDLYKLSQSIILNKTGFFGQAYNLSFSDIYDYCSVKQSLKKWEIALGIHHLEVGIPWDQDVPEERWNEVATYCKNDVLATEAVFEARIGDFDTRCILASLSGLTANNTNREHITKILIGDKKQADHVYTDLSKIYPGYEHVRGEDGKMHNMYRDTDVGFGGYVFAEPGMYQNVALLDVGNMHGASIIALNKFGADTKNYIAIREARMAIKRGLKTGDFSEASKMLDGKLAPYLTSAEQADQLQNALKLVLNSTYGIAAAKFDNPLRDPRDVNNIIALRGALFMRTLQDEVTSKGFKVVHIKTDSIKIPDATPDLINYILEFGRQYGYEFEHEATYEKMCLVNDAVYIAKYDSQGIRNKGGIHANEWTATGKQFQVPYVFKTLFSDESIEFEDLCETYSVSTSMYLDMNEGLGPDEHNYVFVGRVGQFCPILPGHGGGELKSERDGKFNFVQGCKGYRWLESELVKQRNLMSDIDRSYYNVLVTKAIDAISKFGDFEKFVGEEGYDYEKVGDPLFGNMNPPEEELPWN